MSAVAPHWVVIFVHFMGNPVMDVRSEGEFATKEACQIRIEALNRRECGTWYYACRESR